MDTLLFVLCIIVAVGIVGAALRRRRLRNGDWHPGRFDEMRRYGPNGWETRRMVSGDGERRWSWRDYAKQKHW